VPCIAKPLKDGVNELILRHGSRVAAMQKHLTMKFER
jgi:hypothetical protein